MPRARRQIPAVIQISDLEFRYADGDFALRIPSLQIERGTTVAFIGPSGSGKTTLLNLIGGIAKPLGGRVVTHDVEVTALNDSARRDFRIRNIGLVFQEFELLEYLTVLDNVLLPYRINSSMMLSHEVRERATQLATQVGIADKLVGFAVARFGPDIIEARLDSTGRTGSSDGPPGAMLSAIEKASPAIPILMARRHSLRRTQRCRRPLRSRNTWRPCRCRRSGPRPRMRRCCGRRSVIG